MFFASDQLSFNQRRDLLAKAVSSHCGEYCFLMDAYDSFLIYQEWEETGMQTFKIGYKIGKDFSVKLNGESEAVIGLTTYNPVTYAEFSEDYTTFSTEVTEDAQYVYKIAKIFHCDNYPDKQFSLNETEADAACHYASQSHIPLDIEHQPTVFDGVLGHLVTAWRVGKEMFGRIAFNKDIYKALGGKPLKLSCEWDQFSKTLRKLSLVLTPRIPDAVCMAAFSQRDPARVPPVTPEGNSPMNEEEKKSLFAQFREWLGGKPTEPVIETVAPAPAPVAPLAPVVDFAATVEAEVNKRMQEADRQAEQVAFTAANETAIDLLIAQFKVLPADKQKELDERATNPALYDRYAQLMPKLAKFASTVSPSLPAVPHGMVDAATVFASAHENPEKAEQLTAIASELEASGRYETM